MPLHLASTGGHSMVVSALVAAGADVSAKNTRGECAVDLAANDATRHLLASTRLPNCRLFVMLYS